MIRYRWYFDGRQILRRVFTPHGSVLFGPFNLEGEWCPVIGVHHDEVLGG